MRYIWSFLFSMGILLLCATAVAQVGTQSSITGTVMDTSGAVIPGATVTATQTSTQLERTSTSDGRGNFEIQALPIGLYSVTVAAPGMKQWKIDRLQLTIGASVKISPQLQVGSVNQQVTVHARTTIQTENTSTSTVLDVPTLLNYPNPTRNPVSLVELVPGMRYDGTSGPEGGAFVHGMGLRGNTASFSLDGINVNAPNGRRRRRATSDG